MQGEPLKAGEGVPGGRYTGERGDRIKWRESKGRRECVVREGLRGSVPPLKGRGPRAFPWRA